MAIIKLQDSYKGYTLDADKHITPENTVENLMKRFQEKGLKIVKDVERVDLGILGIPTIVCHADEDFYRIVRRYKSEGKGYSEAQARASGLMEMVERYSFFSYLASKENFIFDSPDRVMDRSIEPIDMLKSLNLEEGEKREVLELIKNIPTPWTTATDMNTSREVLLPLNWFQYIQGTNGLAAGNTMEEAISQGLCEVVERHVSAVITSKKMVVPTIDPESIRDPVAEKLLEKFDKKGITVIIKNFTLGMGVPTIGVYAYDSRGTALAAGTTPSPEKALIRALTEIAQLAPDFETRKHVYVPFGLPVLPLEEAEYLTRDTEVISIQDLPDKSHDNMKIEVENIVAALKGGGFNTYVVDTTHPKLKIPAVSVSLPGSQFRMGTVTRSPHLYIGLALMNTKRFEEAIPHFKKALEKEPEDKNISYFLKYCRAQARAVR